ncbi:MAG: chlorite dismutase family protein [Rhodoglobus sp.]|nr:chlorite dismutase family protein [Rhodoglobus sp.]
MPEGAPGGFTLFAVLGRQDRAASTAEAGVDDFADLRNAIERLAGTGVVLRGFYDVSGMRASAELMLWLHGDDPAGLQLALRSIRRTTALAPMQCLWSAMGVHREAEFNKRHIPGYLRSEHPREWLCVYPFVRSYEWYLLPDEERAALLAEHGRKGAAFTDVVANTVSTFGLSDYEWILPLESDNLLSLVDMMRELRATGARRHVREEVPFFTGRRVSVAELAEVLS